MLAHPAFSQRVNRVAGSQSLSSTIKTSALDADDNVVQTTCVTEKGARIG